MQIKNKKGNAGARTNPGVVFHLLGGYEKAYEYHEKALAISMETTDKVGEADARTNQGKVLYLLGEFQKAKEHYEKALAIYMVTSHSEKVMQCFLGLGGNW